MAHSGHSSRGHVCLLLEKTDITKLGSATLKMPSGSCCLSLNLVPIKGFIGSNRRPSFHLQSCLRPPF
jgi:hypothetical protein